MTFLFFVPLIIFLDQTTKIFFTRVLSLNQSLPVIRGVFHLTLIHNRGAAFGILRNQAWLFIFTAIIAIALIYSNLKSSTSRLLSYKLALSFIASGALGNLIDRLIFGYVIDFLDFRIWPVFNIADSAITIGAILLGYSFLKCAKNPD